MGSLSFTWCYLCRCMRVSVNQWWGSCVIHMMLITCVCAWGSLSISDSWTLMCQSHEVLCQSHVTMQLFVSITEFSLAITWGTLCQRMGSLSIPFDNAVICINHIIFSGNHMRFCLSAREVLGVTFVNRMSFFVIVSTNSPCCVLDMKRQRGPASNLHWLDGIVSQSEEHL